LILSLVGCSSNTNKLSESNENATDYTKSGDIENPFEKHNDQASIASLVHGLKFDNGQNKPSFTYDGNEVNCKYYVNASGSGKHVGFLMFINGVSSSEGGISFKTVIESGQAAVIEFDIELDKLDDLNTFYIISVPTNAADYPDEVFDSIKTDSIMLYK